MDALLTVLILIIVVLCNLLIMNNKKTFKKYKNFIYTILLIIIALLFITFKKTKIEKFQPSGYNKSKRNVLLKRCGLPLNYDKTGHCFNDGTHHTCCNLGIKSLNYAKSKNNNIKDPAIDAYIKANYKTKNINNALRNQIINKLNTGELKIPWCTCSGSQVCSFYGNTFGDSNIKFMNNPNTDSIFADVPLNCEQSIAKKTGIIKHSTPGITNQTQVCKKNVPTKKVL